MFNPSRPHESANERARDRQSAAPDDARHKVEIKLFGVNARFIGPLAIAAFIIVSTAGLAAVTIMATSGSLPKISIAR